MILPRGALPNGALPSPWLGINLPATIRFVFRDAPVRLFSFLGNR